VTRVLIISFTDLARDPRVGRQISFLDGRFDLVAAGLRPPAIPSVEFIDISGPPRRLLGRVLGAVRLVARRYDDVYWKHPTNRAVLSRLEGIPADVVLANDLASLPIATRLGPPVAFDAHEYAPEEFSERLGWRLLMQPYISWLCARYIPEAASMMTVSEGIAEAFERETGVRATVVLNAPAKEEFDPTPVHSPVRVLHHGAAQPGRGLEELVEMARLLEDRFVLDLVLVEGEPGYRDALIARARGNPRISFPDPVPTADLARMANGYDIGVSVLPAGNANQANALPNKFFEFVQGRLAIAIGPSAEMGRLVRRYALGVIAEDFTPESLARAINGLDADSIARFKSASHVAASDLCAERNADLVLRAVEDALGRPAQQGRVDRTR
jgi:hypothetical protein